MPGPSFRKKTTLRQRRAAAEYLYGRDVHATKLTQAEIARKFGVQQAAISKRLARFVSSLSVDQQERYLQLVVIRRGAKNRVNALQLNQTDIPLTTRSSGTRRGTCQW